MTAAGKLRLEATWSGTGVPRVVVASTRPQAAQVLVGRTVGEALKLVPALFSVCKQAQGAAALAACTAAGASVERPEGWLEERTVAAEAAQEHLWRLMIDWPELFGHAPRRERFAILFRRLAKIKDERTAFELGGDLLDLVAVELLGGFFRATREPSGLREFVERARRGGTIGAALGDLIEMGTSTKDADSVPLLPTLNAAAWANELGAMPSAAFCMAPTYCGQPYETGALARHADSMMVKVLLRHGHRVAARLFARVIDLADCASRLRHPLASDMSLVVDAAKLGERGGVACVETARGTLLHAVRLEGDLIADYAIVAPTEWNFHPAGAFVREGKEWEAPSREVALLRLKALSLSLDPCVEYEIAFAEAADA